MNQHLVLPGRDIRGFDGEATLFSCVHASRDSMTVGTTFLAKKRSYGKGFCELTSY